MTTPQQSVPGQIPDHDASGGRAWATGIARFAGVVMILLGIVYMVVGTDVLLRGDVAGGAVQHAFSISAGVWGWIQITVGALVGLAGTGVVAGQLWGRVVGIALVCLSLGVAFLSMSHHPAGLVLALALGVAVIWALCTFDEEASAASPTLLD
jgi:hypothetical protein